MAATDLGPGLSLPRRERRYRFSMTPLADVMFQLLVFFMLSANITPYSLIDIRTGGLRGGTPAGAAAAGAGAGRGTDIRSTAVWTLGPDGQITASGQRFAPDRLPVLADALVAQGTRDVLVVVGQGARVQQVVTVLQALNLRGITSVQIAGGGTAQ